jgi:outer membrane protein OmpA-like peptidoglycan-associated protein
MPTSHGAQDLLKKDQPCCCEGFHQVRNEGANVENERLRGAVRVAPWIFAAAVLLSANGCIATRGWVQDQLNPISDQLARQQSQLNDTNAKADRALTGLENLHLERRLVLGSSQGPTFAFGSAALTVSDKSEIDGFFRDLEGSTKPGSASERVFLVAGHTDSVGTEDYNYELGQRRAETVAGYMVGREGVDPTQVRVISYGASKPMADNSTALGRRSNRRVEILVYQEKITTRGAEQPMQTGGQTTRAQDLAGR